jgi:two-component system sensor histidine kinase VanS
MSARLKLTLSYAGFLVIAGVVLLAAVWVFLLRYVPDGSFMGPGPFVPSRSDLLRAFAPAAAAVLGFLLVFGLVGGWLLAGRMLAPLRRITQVARQTTEGALSHRIRLSGRDDEFRELADAFDAMLDRVEAHVAEQRRFAANASHELRTPLATTQALLDVALSDPESDTPRLLERLRSVNARAIDITEALLLLSRADQRSVAREVVDLSLIAEEAAENLQALAERRGVVVEVSGDVALMRGTPTLLLPMVSNLVQNAIVHNRAEGGTVEVVTSTHAGSVRLVVDNTGEVVPPALVSTLTEPFQRGAGRIRSPESGHTSGVGLGLAIVKSIVLAQDGSLDIVSRPSGGLGVTVDLPRA